MNTSWQDLTLTCDRLTEHASETIKVRRKSVEFVQLVEEFHQAPAPEPVVEPWRSDRMLAHRDEIEAAEL